MPFNPPRQSTLYTPRTPSSSLQPSLRLTPLRALGECHHPLLLPGLYHVGQLMEFAFTDQIPCGWRINQ